MGGFIAGRISDRPSTYQQQTAARGAGKSVNEWEQATRLIEQGNLDGAAVALSRIIDGAPDTWHAYALRAQVQLGRKRYAEAVTDADRAIALAGNSPQTAQAYLIRGQARVAADKSAGHIAHRYGSSPERRRDVADFNRAVQLAPD